MAAREAGCGVILWGRREQPVGAARQLGLEATTDLGEALSGADLVVLAVPVGAMDVLGARLKGDLESGALVTDVGSVKA